MTPRSFSGESYRPSKPARAGRATGTTYFGMPPRELILLVILTFPVIGTLFPLDSYLQSGSGSLASLVSKTPLNTTLILVVILGYVGWLYLQEPRKSLLALRRNWIIFAFLLWAFATSRWAYNPGLSFNRTGRMLVFSLYAIYIVEFIPLKRTIRLLSICLALSCFISLMMIAGAPSMSYTVDLRGAWRGAMQHKNNLGNLAGLTFVAMSLMLRSKVIDARFCLAVAFLALGLIVLANSATALLSVFVIGCIMFYVLYFADKVRSNIIPIAALFFLAAIMFFIATNTDIVLTALGRDSTLTGRGEIWAFARALIDANPFWGYGNGAWGSPDMKLLVMEVLKWPSPHAHNGWLDFRLQLGLPGFVLAIAMWAIAAINLLRLVVKRRLGVVVLPAAALTFLGIRSYAETIIVDPSLNDMFWFVFAYASFLRVLADIKLQKYKEASQFARDLRLRRRQAVSVSSLGHRLTPPLSSG